MRQILSKLADRRGVAAIEFAMIVPILLVLAGGAFELSALLRANAAINRLVMQYTVSFADCSDTSSGVCQTELNEYVTTTTITNLAPQISAGSITLNMAQVIMNGTTPTVEYAYPSGLSLSAAQIAVLTATVGSGQTGVVVTATYPYHLQIFATLMAPIIGSSFTLTYTAAQLK